ncbi:MAG: aminotransferase class I/II-fold pyridoxal phosphate-dependent enzyme [Legionella sp.]|nr:aminotransferase class I/II-fold pyridoxal phosphate-dependent enzyme [Legionella sp.]
MLTPEGQSGDETDKIMLLAMWTNTLKNEAGDKAVKEIISAGMGKPTFPINMHTVTAYLSYWKVIESLVKTAQENLEKNAESAALDYGDPRGDADPRKIMAEAMTKWYKLSAEQQITPDNILFTVGGAGALRVIFESFNRMYHDTPKYRVITPFPHYSLYSDNQHQLHPIDVMKEPGYQLTAKALEASIKSAYKLAEKDHNYPKVFLLSNPSNPLGTIIPEEELKKIAVVLRQYPDIKIVVDEAYAEMAWKSTKIPSFLDAAPDLRDRTVILRSATKALSAAGERMAVIMAFQPDLMTAFRNKNIGTIGHAPRSAQLAYALTMSQFSSEEHTKLHDFYKPKVDFVFNRVREIGIAMPDPSYTVEGTFYVLADLSDLLGTDIPEEATRALGKSKTGKITTSEELIYSLLFKEGIMLAPGCYFGMPEKTGFVRITCSGKHEELKEMMDRLESVILQVRQEENSRLRKEFNILSAELAAVDPGARQILDQRYEHVPGESNNVFDLKQTNQLLKELVSDTRIALKRATPEGRQQAALVIKSFLSKAKSHEKAEKFQKTMDIEWRNFVNQNMTDGPLKNHFLNLSEQEKQTFKPWVDYLNSREDLKPNQPKI